MCLEAGCWLPILLKAALTRQPLGCQEAGRRLTASGVAELVRQPLGCQEMAAVAALVTTAEAG